MLRSFLQVLESLELHDRPLMPLQLRLTLVSGTKSELLLHQVHVGTHMACSYTCLDTP